MMGSASPTGMVALPGGVFTMGADRFYPEERPARRVAVDGFAIDAAPVTNRGFARFVEATGHVTQAEIAPDPADYPGMPPEMAWAGSLVFTPPRRAVPMDDPLAWWTFAFGANWRHPTGPESSLQGLWDHPVVHVGHGDAAAYAAWAGKALPTEAEWEYAARGGLEGADYAWGSTLSPGGAMLANLWQGPFPHGNLLTDGFARTSPVGHFPPNGFALFDMIGNVWEWTDDWWGVAGPERPARPARACCVPRNPRGGAEMGSHDPATPAVRIPRKVLKGGSYLCAPSYCRRYRPAARHPEPVDTTAGHVGFRCVVRA